MCLKMKTELLQVQVEYQKNLACQRERTEQVYGYVKSPLSPECKEIVEAWYKQHPEERRRDLLEELRLMQLDALI